MSHLSAPAANLNWLVNSFVERVPAVRNAVIIDADGLPLASSFGLDRAAIDRLSAVASGLKGLANEGAGRFGGGRVKQVTVQMDNAALFVAGIADGSLLSVMADEGCDAALVSYGMADLVERAGVVLTPELRTELQGALPQ